ncbi:type II toxin-antitoxin system VapC family toxin [Micromonospora echinaurantiaca]|uniref:type II toxin-antitoxin system VapC family toxin n=1 Tax=Micromonospora TaxID=1873 RepID=UPI000D6FBD15|nr:type II toxin-antitoxin system VapC family toxin [Micromonospora sp. S4605]PWU45515.1 VapC toxin family PIN domain ribonuclease [Micromonospora sp. S4605]
MSGDSPVRGLIDTNIVIHLGALDPQELPEELVISAVTLAELSAGPHHADDRVERARRTSVLQHAEATFEPLPFDAEAARAFGMITGAVLATGRTTRRRLADLMIASIAYANGLPLYTTNPSDFLGLEELITIQPLRRP